MRIGNLLRHAAEIELCLAEEEAQELTLSGPLGPDLDIGGNFGADVAYTIADDGRVELIEAPLREQRLYDLLPADTDTVLIMDTDCRAKLYTVQFSRMIAEAIAEGRS